MTIENQTGLAYGNLPAAPLTIALASAIPLTSSLPAVVMPNGDIEWHDPVQQPSTPAKAVESTMSTATAVAAPSGFKNVLDHILKFVTLGLVDIQKYTPSVAALAEVLFPAEAPLTAAAAATTQQVAGLIQSTILTIQAKYASAPAGTETNAAKLADALSIVEAPAISLLATAGISADTTRIANAVNATVAILKNANVPA
jgi:hypothetical protein